MRLQELRLIAGSASVFVAVVSDAVTVTGWTAMGGEGVRFQTSFFSQAGQPVSIDPVGM